MFSRHHAIAVCILLISAPLYGAAARPGWTKIELVPVDDNDASVPPGLLAAFGAEPIADYGAYAIAYAPQGVVNALQRRGREVGVRIRRRDELDVLALPGGSVDVRQGIVGVPPAGLISGYPAGKPGVFVLQLVAPPRPEWVAELRALGWTLSRYVPNDGYLVVGPPELRAGTLALGYVQWLDFFHPYQKATYLPGDEVARDRLFELPAGAASEAGVEAIRGAAEGPIEVRRGSLDTLVYARMSDAAALALLRDPMILSVGLRPIGELSDGRQSQSLSPLLDAQQTQPTPPPPPSPSNPNPKFQYWNWVLDHCAECSNMPAATWKIGVADTGLDNGYFAYNQFGQGHPDLAGRKFFGILGFAGANDPECAWDAPLCDVYRHGTLVAGMAAGNGSTQSSDASGFLLGLGGVPTAGIFMTKFMTASGSLDANRLLLWTADAANNGVTLQNHSWQVNQSAGQYNFVSRWFDIAARDADDEASSARIPLLMTVASGNDYFATGLKTSPVGMAKNVLTVGGLENYRPDANGFNCYGTQGDSFRNVMRISRVGTALPGYVKPDLMAPGALAMSTQTSMWWPDPLEPPNGYCLEHYTSDFRYNGASGTSFAAPLGAAASIIVKRYLGSSPGSTSPALIRATLIAGARSVRGGEDRTKTPAIPVGPVPSQQQGFGRLTLEDILNGAQKPVFFDQSPSRLFTQAGQSFCAQVKVRDAAKPAKVALVWTDTPATAGVTNPQVNDLNLEVRRGSNPSNVYVGNSLAVTSEANGEESVGYPASGTLPLDHVNNVEYFRSFLNVNEELNVAVKAWSIAGDTDGNTGTFEQDFALVALNADLVSVGCSSPSVWVSASGSDGNDCSPTAPCRTFAAALARSVPGGEIRVLNSGDFGPLTIDRSISIVANGVLGGIHAGSGTAITVNAGAADKIVLRGLTLDGLGTGLDGISFVAGGSLHVESCTINNFGRYGIDFAPASGSGKLAVTDTILRNNGVAATGGGLHLISTTAPGPIAAVDGLRSENNVFGLKAETYGAVTVRNSLAANNGYSGFSAVTPAGSSSDVLRVLVENSVATHNGTNGVLASGAGSTVTISNLAVTNNQTGLLAGSGGAIVSLGNNKVQGNVTNGAPTQTIASQ